MDCAGYKPNSCKIFGTPPEPIFRVHSQGGTDKTMLDEWLLALSRLNAREIKNITSNENYFKKGPIVENVFLLCEKFRVSSEARYLAIELFNKFMVQHIRDLHNHVMASGSSTKASEWAAIVTRISNQVVLRIVSCIQVASKMTSHYRVVTNSSAVRTLKQSGHNFNSDSVLMSEIRVLKTLNYNINIQSPLAYLETMLELLGKSWPECNVKVSHSICQLLLDTVYIKHADIYGQLYETLSNHTTTSQQQRAEFAVVETDKMFMSAGIIVTSMWIYNRTNFNKVLLNSTGLCVEIMESVSGVIQEDLTDFSTVLIQILLT